MPQKLGRFELASELNRSGTAVVYKAEDPESSQTVVLKAMKFAELGEQREALLQALHAEAEAGKSLASHNIALLYDAGEVDDNFWASMEYVQGNSTATMLARKEGFSIWDLQDIARQSCQGLDHAHAKSIFHYTLEPGKVMVSWDGTVKILGFGVSTMGAFAAQASGKAPETLHYMSPEQLHGDPLDARSNIFSLGAILYEMVTEKKVFDGADADEVRRGILESTPIPPAHIKGKVNPVLSEVILKALSKSPDDRYASGKELVADLERCKQSAAKASEPKPASAKSAAQICVDRPAATVQKPQPTAAGRAAAAASSSPAAAIAKAAAAAIATSEKPAAQTVEVMSFAPTTEAPAAAPKFATDPTMGEGRTPGNGRSFSEINELPPLKEIYISPKEDPVEEPGPVDQQDKARDLVFRRGEPDKPKMQVGEAAKHAISEIRKTPPKVFLFSIAGALAIILAIVGFIAWKIRSENPPLEAGPVQSSGSATVTSPIPVGPASAPAEPAVVTPPSTPAASSIIPEAPTVSIKQKHSRSKKAKPVPVAAPVVLSSELNVSSSPAGAQIQFDGQSNASWITPYNIAGVSPGTHSVLISKAGFKSETRSINITVAGKSFLAVQLAALTATAALASDPIGAEIWMDGKDTGRSTPAQLSVDRPGSHLFLFKKQGYLDETASANLQIGQTSHLSPTLKPLGNTDDIRTGGRFKKLFGGSETAGMGTVTVKTQPKGAQIAVNNRMLDKTSPVEFYLNPGNYIVDVTLSGFKTVHRVINVEKNGKILIDENMDRE